MNIGKLFVMVAKQKNIVLVMIIGDLGCIIENILKSICCLDTLKKETQVEFFARNGKGIKKLL